MKYLLLVLLVVSVVSAKKNKCTFEWRDNEGRFLQSFNRETKAYPSLKKAKKACAKDAGCGAVGLDKIPYRKVPGGPVIYAQTIYLIPGEFGILQSGTPSWRYGFYVKGECKSKKKKSKTLKSAQ